MTIDGLVLRGGFILCLHSCLLAQNVSFQHQSVPMRVAMHVSVASGDLNRDGKPDLAIANYANATVSVLLGRGDGDFDAEAPYSVKSAPTSIAIADFNGDGIPDLVVANYGSSQVSVLLGNGNGTFQPASNYRSYATSKDIQPYSVAVGDFNGDGKADLVITNFSNIGFPFVTGTTVSVLLGKGDGTYQPPVEFAAGSGPLPVAVADMNGDGHLDLVVGTTSQTMCRSCSATATGLSSRL